MDNSIKKGYKFRIYPTQEQKIKINKNFGCVRFVYNYFLEQRIQNYKLNGNNIGYLKQQNYLPTLKKQYPWLKEADSTSLQMSIRCLDRAFENFFKNNKFGFPNFKSKKSLKNSYTINCVNSNIIIEHNRIKIPKLKWIKTKTHRRVNGKILNATISENGDGKYYLSILAKEDKETMTNYFNNKMLIINVNDFININNKNNIYYFKYIKYINKLKSNLLRKQNNSQNSKKIKAKLNKFKNKLNCQQNDFLNKITKNIIDENQIICINRFNEEFLNAEDYALWKKFCYILSYKCDWYNKKIIDNDDNNKYLTYDAKYFSMNIMYHRAYGI